MAFPRRLSRSQSGRPKACYDDVVRSTLFRSPRYDDLAKLSGENLTMSQRYIEVLPDMAIFMLAGVLGCWYGQRQKPVYSLAFVMRMLPRKVGPLIVEMAGDEAMRAHPPAMTSPS